MSTLDERITDLEHRMLALEQSLDKLMMEKSPMYSCDIDSADGTLSYRKVDEE